MQSAGKLKRALGNDEETSIGFSFGFGLPVDSDDENAFDNLTRRATAMPRKPPELTAPKPDAAQRSTFRPTSPKTALSKAAMSGLAFCDELEDEAMRDPHYAASAAPEKDAQGREIKSSWRSEAGVKFELVNGVFMSSLKDVHRKWTRRVKAQRSDAEEKMLEHLRTNTHYGNSSKEKTRQKMFAQSADSKKVEINDAFQSWLRNSNPAGAMVAAFGKPSAESYESFENWSNRRTRPLRAAA